MTFIVPVSEIFAYSKGYRRYSSWTVGAYGIDLRELQLENEGCGRC
jgi:hypothetical protein